MIHFKSHISDLNINALYISQNSLLLSVLFDFDLYIYEIRNNTTIRLFQEIAYGKRIFRKKTKLAYHFDPVLSLQQIFALVQICQASFPHHMPSNLVRFAEF